MISRNGQTFIYHVAEKPVSGLDIRQQQSFLKKILSASGNVSFRLFLNSGFRLFNLFRKVSPLCKTGFQLPVRLLKTGGKLHDGFRISRHVRTFQLRSNFRLFRFQPCYFFFQQLQFLLKRTQQARLLLADFRLHAPACLAVQPGARFRRSGGGKAAAAARAWFLSTFSK